MIWFGDSLRRDDLCAAFRAPSCDLFIALGTSAVVYPAAGLVQEARGGGAFTVEINPEATPASAAVDLAIHAGAEVALPLVASLMKRP